MPVRLGNDSIEIINPDKTYVVDTIKSTGERDGDTVVNVPVVSPDYVKQSTVSQYTVLDADADHLVAWYKFDTDPTNGATLTNYGSGGSEYDATLNIASNGIERLPAENVGYKYHWKSNSATGNYISIPPTILEELYLNGHTICFWAKDASTSDTDYTVVATNSTGDGSDVYIRIHTPWSNGNIYYDNGNGSGITNYSRLYGASGISANQLVFWTFTRENISSTQMILKIYKNGIQFLSNTLSRYDFNSSSSSSVFYVGYNTSGDFIFKNKSLEDFRIYDKALTPTEIGYLANNMIKLEPQPIAGTTEYKYLAFTAKPYLVYDFNQITDNTPTGWNTFVVNNIPNSSTSLNYADSGGSWRHPGVGFVQFTLPSDYDYVNVIYTNSNSSTASANIVILKIDGVEKSRANELETITYGQSYTTGQVIRIEENDGGIIGKNMRITLSLSQTPYTLTFDNPTECDILIVGGGGGGGGDNSGGGGAGGLIFAQNHTFNGSYDILIGKGGAGDPAQTGASNGIDTLIREATTSQDIFKAYGGGAGGTDETGASIAIGKNGGSGGGGAGSTHNTTCGTATQTGINNYGNNGGSGSIISGQGSSGQGAGGGGGGAGGVGLNGNDPLGGRGGVGISEINGIVFKTHFNLPTDNLIGQYIATEDKVYFAGGGGAGNDNAVASTGSGDTLSNRGGKGGGGEGGTNVYGNHKGQPGLSNSGGGGGGGTPVYISGTWYDGGSDGGSGIVIIRYKQQYNQVPFNAQWTYSAADTSVHHYGNVGIGTTASDTTKLAIRGDVNVIGDYYKNDILLTEQWKTSSQNTNNIYREQGFVGIGTNNVDYGIHVIGQLYAGSGGITGNGSTAWTSTSDSRVKQNIVPASGQKCVENVRNINLYRFNYNSSLIDTDDKHQLGFIAQEVQQYYPKAVKTNNLVLKNNMKIDNLLSVDVTQINYTLYGTVKKLAEDINTIREKLGITEIQTDVKNLAYVRKDGEDSDGLKIS
jgi:hypothetical protein